LQYLKKNYLAYEFYEVRAMSSIYEVGELNPISKNDKDVIQYMENYQEHIIHFSRHFGFVEKFVVPTYVEGANVEKKDLPHEETFKMLDLREQIDEEVSQNGSLPSPHVSAVISLAQKKMVTAARSYRKSIISLMKGALDHSSSFVMSPLYQQILWSIPDSYERRGLVNLGVKYKKLFRPVPQLQPVSGNLICDDVLNHIMSYVPSACMVSRRFRGEFPWEYKFISLSKGTCWCARGCSCKLFCDYRFTNYAPTLIYTAKSDCTLYQAKFNFVVQRTGLQSRKPQFGEIVTDLRMNGSLSVMKSAILYNAMLMYAEKENYVGLSYAYLFIKLTKPEFLRDDSFYLSFRRALEEKVPDLGVKFTIKGSNYVYCDRSTGWYKFTPGSPITLYQIGIVSGGYQVHDREVDLMQVPKNVVVRSEFYE